MNSFVIALKTGGLGGRRPRTRIRPRLPRTAASWPVLALLQRIPGGAWLPKTFQDASKAPVRCSIWFPR